MQMQTDELFISLEISYEESEFQWPNRWIIKAMVGAVHYKSELYRHLSTIAFPVPQI